MEVDEALKVAGLALPWSFACINVAVVPYFKKRELLYKDYESSGAMAAAQSAIESKRLVDALAGMFEGILEKQEDKRRKVEIRDLLQMADFLPDFREAEVAYRDMSAIDRSYAELKRASGLWRWGAFHSLVTVLVPLACVDLTTLGAWDWLTVQRVFPVVALAWLLSLAYVVKRFLHFHGLMNNFLHQLEAAKGNHGRG